MTTPWNNTKSLLDDLDIADWLDTKTEEIPTPGDKLCWDTRGDKGPFYRTLPHTHPEYYKFSQRIPERVGKYPTHWRMPDTTGNK